MKLMCHDQEHARWVLTADADGVHILYQRSSVFPKIWYAKDKLTVLWPWRRR